MNKWEKEVAQSLLNDEKEVIKEIEKQYKKALADIGEKIRILQSDDMTVSKIYHLQYQMALKAQVEGALNILHSSEFTTIQKYLNSCYTKGFIGTMYNLNKQGVPLLLPIDQKAMLRAILTDSKLKEDLYKSLGVDIAKLKKTITAEISRGIATGMPYTDIARNISNATGTSRYHAKRIVNTEGHRIQQASTYDAQQAAKAKGADVVKQWDATLDGATREVHRELDGQIREVDEPFEAYGKKAMYPGDFGDPAEDCNCRCVSLTRARAALDEDELKILNERAAFFGLDKPKTLEEYSGNYLNFINNSSLQQSEGFLPPPEMDGVFDDFEELNLSKIEEAALLSLHSAAMESGHEYGLIIEGGKTGALFTSNLSDTIQVKLDGYGDGLTLLHSHTNATPFSIADFRYLLDKKVDKIGVIGYNNDIFMAYIGNGERPSLEEFSDIVDEIKREVTLSIRDYPNFYDWTVAERQYMAVREQAYRIARHFGWTMEGGRGNGT